MSAQAQQVVPEFVQTYPGVSGTKTVFAVAGLAGGWYLHKTMIPDITKDKTYSFKAPYRFKTTYLLYATTLGGYLVGGFIGNMLYGPSKAEKKAAEKKAAAAKK